MGIRERKQFFVDELKRHYQELISSAHEAEAVSAESAQQISSESRRKEDKKGALQATRTADGHKQRRERAAGELKSLVALGNGPAAPVAADAPVGIGALVDVSIEGDEGTEIKTLFLLPVGAGTELSGPGGDGFIQVISPESPVGQALCGSRAGDGFEISIRGSEREWTVIDVC
jgi:transcription elongation GreA/GreB family factor